jgi:hypothetical protein
VKDLSRREFFVLLPLAFLTILLGLFPNIILDAIHFTVSTLIIDNSSISSLHSSSQILNSLPFISDKVLLALFPSLVSFKSDDTNINEEESSSTHKFIYDDILASRSQIMKDLKGKAGIYQFINKDDPLKMYIGSSINLWERINEHLRKGSNSNYTYNSLLYRAIQKYSWNSFKLIILEFTSYIKEDILSREQFYLDLYRPYYNILTEAGNSLGYKHSEVIKQKMSEVKKGRFLGENNPMYGKNHSEETKEKMSQVKGFTIFLYNSDCSTLISTFFSAAIAAKFLKSNTATILNYARSHHIFKNEYILSLEPLSSDFKPPLGIKKSGPKGTTIYVYNLDHQLLYTFYSFRDAAKYFNANDRTIMKFARSEGIFRDKYILSLKE